MSATAPRRNPSSLVARLALAIGLVSGAARGQTGVAPGSLRYSASSGCPDEAAFRAQLASRLNAPVETKSGLSLFVEVAVAEPSHGTLVVVDATGTSVRREVDGATCDEVVDAIALMAAVLLEGRSEPGVQSAEPPMPTPPRTPPRGVVARDVDSRPTASPASVPLGWAVGAHAVLLGGVAPSLAAGVRAMAELGIDRPGVFRPALRLSFAWTARTSAPTAVSNTHLSFLSGRAEACPLRLEGAHAALVPCATFDLGRIAVDPGTGSRARLWLAPGIVARATWSVTRFLDLEVEGGLAFPLLRYHFFFEPEPQVYRVPAVGGTGGLGAAFRFP